MNKYLVEALGTFLLVFCIYAAVANAGEFTPLAIGLTLVALVYAGGHISQAHYNPAVTIAIWLRKAMKKNDVLPYIIAQFLGGALAAFLSVKVFNWQLSGNQEFDILQGFVAEFIGTFILVWVILNVAFSKGTANTNFYGISIGFTVAGLIFCLGKVGSGAAFNPAVAVSASIGGLMNWSYLWLYFIANFSGSILAFLFFKISSPSDFD